MFFNYFDDNLGVEQNVLTVHEQQFFKVMDGKVRVISLCVVSTALCFHCDGKVFLSFTVEAFGFSVLLKYA